MKKFIAFVPFLLFALAIVAALTMPTSYLVEMPGNVFPVSGGQGKETVVEVDGGKAYPSQTQLYMTTVSVAGNASYGAQGAAVLIGMLHPHWQVLPVRSVYPEEVTAQEQQKRGEQQMESAQSSAEILAIEKAGYEVTMRLTVADVPEESPAYGTLREGDVLTSIEYKDERVEADSYSAFTGVLADVKPGETVRVGYIRHGKAGVASIVTESHEADVTGWKRPGSRLGISLTTSEVKSTMAVKYELDDVGGPSAGTMFALGIYDELTPGSLAGSNKVAGTGTISLAGEVGAIGGITHKMQGASSQGIKYFLAPASNCDEVVGNVPAGMNVYAIRTFDEGVEALQAIGKGDTKKLSTCEAVMKK